MEGLDLRVQDILCRYQRSQGSKMVSTIECQFPILFGFLGYDLRPFLSIIYLCIHTWLSNVKQYCHDVYKCILSYPPMCI